MSSHRAILTKLFEAKNLSHAKIAKAMGWKAAATVGHKLRGERPWQEGELLRMCELAGVTLVWLADQADDLRVVKHRDAAHGAVLLDQMTDQQRSHLIALMEAMASGRSI